MNLFNDASLIITPNGVKTGKLYALKGDDLNVTRATSATRVNASGLIELVGANVPRLDYSNGTCPSILVEPQRTNLYLRSQEFDNANWEKSNTTVNANQTASPDGTTTAEKLNDIISGSSNDYLLNVQSALSYTSGTPYTVSFYAKNIDRRYMYIRFVPNAFGVNKYAYFDLQNGVISKLDSGATATITSVGDGWYRCTATYTATVTTSTIYGVYIGLSADGLNNFYVNPSVKSVYIWGAQLEAGSYTTSYIPTTSASVTRNADVISKTGISSLIGQTEGTIFCDVNLNLLNSNGVLLSLSNGSFANFIILAISSSNKIQLFWRTNLGSINSFETPSDVSNAKIAVAYQSGNIVFYVNGILINTGVVDVNWSSPLSQLDLGNELGSVSRLQRNNISALWKTRLTNTQLAELTTI